MNPNNQEDPNWREKCKDCPLVDNCFLKNIMSYCSGMTDVTAMIASIRRKESTLEEVVEWMCNMIDQDQNAKVVKI